MKFWELYISTNNDKHPIAFRINKNIYVLFQGSHRFVNAKDNVRHLCEFSDRDGIFSLADLHIRFLWDKEVEVLECLSVAMGIKQDNPTEEEILSEHEKRKSSDNPERNK